MNLLTVGKTMAKRGMLAPGPPHQQVAQLVALRRWGFGLAGELRQAANRSPKAVAVIDERRGSITYAELLERSERVAAVLQDRGYGEGDRIALLARNHVGAIEVMCGAAAIGVDVVLGNTGLGPAQLAEVMRQQEVAAVIHDDELAEAVSALPVEVERMGESELSALVESAARPELAPPARGGRTIILTSGTTGTPKGAARKTPGGFGPLISIIDRIPLRAGDRILISAPLFHTWGYAAMQLSIAIRATMVLQRRFRAEEARRALEEHQPDAMFAVPVMLQRMMELPSDPQARTRRALRVVATSGSPYPSGFTTGFMDEFGDVLYNLYGSTEASWVCIATPQDLRRDPDTAGTPPLGTVVKIVDGDGRELPSGQTGRIFCGNELVFDGYTNGQGKEFLDGLVSTGDMGYERDGLYFVVGRDDDMVIVGGENVYPIEVESLLAQHPAVREVSVVGVPDPDLGQRLAAFIALMPGEELTAEEVTQMVRAERARHCVPREVVFLDELPRNATGKVLGRELRQQFS
ncbi:AMP-binding protein [Marihabitans asiaticum]|uniref:Acyl-CoA synthetase (AMP-forming)/AMP-acid ligase II n=1 Tax=Marihabitans asiaticum TaxID=415218 RepID=A0A560WDU7_9MICO|nr:AMP-binding protein [Marihabitans asiaticum]TWD15700.1 acyl-CoA synthetase (AMP-forming)/AMP-acid ligase II [Marihabitans asiaticum]